MPKNSDVASRAWKIIRLALLWARKGGIFKRRLALELRILQKYVKNIGHAMPADQLHCGERELSFDKTPIIHVKMRRPSSVRFHLPCITPQVDFDYDFQDGEDDYDHDHDYDYDYDYDNGRKSFLRSNDGDDDEGIDSRADKFITNFYEQMKLRRQISFLEYHQSTEHKTDS